MKLFIIYALIQLVQSSGHRWDSAHLIQELQRGHDHKEHHVLHHKKSNTFSYLLPVLNNPPEYLTENDKAKASKGFFEQSDLEKATEHIVAMTTKTVCASPKERVICAKDSYPDADVVYEPSCTILHRCDSDTGCCKEANHGCQPHTKQQVSLYFRMVNRKNGESNVVPLSFTNHTSCHCTTKHDHHVHPELTTEQPKFQFDDDEEFVDESTDILDECPRCPKPFTKRLIGDVCHCDCFDSERICIKVKQGRKALSDEQRVCVHRNVCNKPTCGHGRHYDVAFGECRKARFVDDDETTE